jgi:hypothetical protein
VHDRRQSQHLTIGLISVLILLVTFSGAPAESAPDALSFTAPGTAVAVLPEIDEYATMVLGDPWDMNEPTDLVYYRSDSGLVNSTFADGIYSAQMIAGIGNDRITLLTAGAQDNTALRIGKVGYNFPIDANKYRYLTLRLYKSNVEYNSGLVQWFETDAYTTSVLGVSNSYPVPAGAGWHTMVIDLASIGIQLGSKPWSGTVRELIVKPFAGPGAAGATVKLDWARLTAQDPRTARPYTIRWNGGSGEITLYASAGNKTLDEGDIRIASGVNASSGSYTFQTGILPAGDYYIAAVDASGPRWSDAPLRINKVPQLQIEKPSMTSGEKYPGDFILDSWNSSGLRDMNQSLLPWQTSCVSNEQFQDGIYSADLVPYCGGVYVDPILHLGGLALNPAGIPDPTIDTSRFRYLSFRMLHSGTQDVREGWVARFGWWQVAADKYTTLQEVVMSRDIILNEGWNTYFIDLWAPDIVDEAHPVQRSWRDSAPNRLRFDPSELHSTLTPASIHLDWIQLTAVNEVRIGNAYPIEFSSKDGAQLTFYYDTDRNPGNGATRIGTATAGSASAPEFSASAPETAPFNTLQNGYRVFLPNVVNNYTNIVCNPGECLAWNTAGVQPGTYYICAESDDGLNKVYRCSEAPVVLRQ